MTLTQPQRAGIFALLVAVMAATRINHFAVVPDASWAIFLAAGFYLRGSARWAFPVLMAEAVLIDFAVIHSQGIGFWDAYCISPAYWCLIAAYGALWLGGSQLRRHYSGTNLRSLGIAVLALIASVTVCQLIAQGSFYWMSEHIAGARSITGWARNFADWYLPYLATTAMYAGLGAMVHASVCLLTRQQSAQSHHRAN